MFSFEQVDMTGSRLVGALTDIGHIGPKHHGVVIGRSPWDGRVYVAESRHTGYGLATYEDFVSRYSGNADIHIYPNNGEYSDADVARRALAEVANGGLGRYDLVANNCESFSNRAMYGTSTSTQVVNTVVGLVVLVGAVWLIKSS